jgi:dihydrofolate reductase
VEREQRWVLRALSDDRREPVSIVDLYVRSTRLRLRRMETSTDVICTFSQKVRQQAANPERVKLTTMYGGTRRPMPCSTLVFTEVVHQIEGVRVAKLTYTAITSLDGYVADEHGNIDWGAPDEEVHSFINDLERPAGTHLYGRRMYEALAMWETADTFADQRPVMQDFAAIWQTADKIVFSRTLSAVSSARTRIERDFDPDTVRQWKTDATRDITVGGADLAGQAIAAGLVDECHLFLVPIVVGGGTPSLPDNVRLPLELLDQRRFAGGTVHLHYGLVN